MTDQERTPGDGGAAGIDYQINLMLMSMLRSYNHIDYNISLTPENQNAGKFDDIVLTHTGSDGVKHIRMLQLKHKYDETATITYDDLLIDNKKKLNLKTYFQSFVNTIMDKYKDEFKQNLIQDLILFTNLNLYEDMEDFVTEVKDQNDIFHFIKAKENKKFPRLLKFKDSFIHEFQICQLKKVALAIVQYGLKHKEMKENNKVFAKCHGILSQDVFEVKFPRGVFKEKFLTGEGDLHPTTKLLRDLLVKEFDVEYSKKHNERMGFENANELDPTKFELKFSSQFGVTDTKKKKWEEEFTWKADEGQLKEFFKYLVLAVNQPNERELENYVQQEISSQYIPSMRKIVTSELIQKFRSWFKERNTINDKLPIKNKKNKKKNSKVFERKDVEDVLKFIWQTINAQTTINVSKDFCDELCNQGIEFKSIPFAVDLKKFLDEKLSDIFYIESSKIVHSLSLMKVMKCLQENDCQNYLVIHNQNSSRENRKAINLFGTEDHNLLIIREFDEKQEYKNDLGEIRQILSGKGNKQVILIASNFNDPTEEVEPKSHMKLFFSKDDTQYDDLTEAVQRKLREKVVLFQGSRIQFQELYSKNIRVEDGDFWIELIDQREFEISKTICPSVDYNPQYYINRIIYGEDQHSESSDHEKITFSLDDSKNILMERFAERVIILSSSAGMGKSTIFSHWAKMIKQQNESFMVIRLNGINCAAVLKEFADEHSVDSSDVLDKFLIEKLLMFHSRTEKFLINKLLSDEELLNKLVFFFDGFDEIDSKCREVVVGLFKYLSGKKNIRMLGLTTRPHLKDKVCLELLQNAFQLRPFSEQDKIDFLNKFWGSTDNDKTAAELLAKFVKLKLSSLSTCISEKDIPFTDIPLQMRIIGEVYRDEMDDYIASGEDSPAKDIIAIDLYHLYESFIKRKEKIYDQEKSKSAGLSSFEHSVSSIWKLHSDAAISTLFKENETNSINCQVCRNRSLDEKNKSNVMLLTPCLDMGIMQKQGDTISFIHRTFMEFLVAQYFIDSSSSLLSESDQKKRNYFQLMMTESEFIVVRAFVNSRLKSPAESGILGELSKSRKFQLSYGPLEYNRMMITSLLDKSFELYEFVRGVFINYYPKAEPETLCLALDKLLRTGIREFNDPLWCRPYIDVWLIPRLRGDKETSKFIITFLIHQVFFRNEEDPDCISEFLKLLLDCQEKLIGKELLINDDLEEIILTLQPTSMQRYRNEKYLEKYFDDTPISEPVKSEIILRILKINNSFHTLNEIFCKINKISDKINAFSIKM